MKSKKNKLLVILQSNIGGAERMAVTVTKGLCQDKNNVVYCLVGMEDKDKYPLCDFIPDCWKVIKLKKRLPLILLLVLFWTILKESPNTIFTTTFFISDKILLLRKLFQRTKFVVRCENYLYTFKKKQVNRMKHTYKNADLIIAQTEEMKQELLEQIHLEDNKVKVLHNPLDKETIEEKIRNGGNPYPKDDSIILCACGKFAHQKGFDLLIEAFSIVRKKIDNAKLYIVGKNDGSNRSYYDFLLEKAKDLGCTTDVVFAGYQPNPYVYLKYADCFILSSRWEGLPNVMLESLYLGTPVAAFKCIPIIERIVDEGVTGFLAEKENVDDLAAAMLKSLKLGRVISSYKPASIDDFLELFKS